MSALRGVYNVNLREKGDTLKIHSRGFKTKHTTTSSHLPGTASLLGVAGVIFCSFAFLLPGEGVSSGFLLADTFTNVGTSGKMYNIQLQKDYSTFKAIYQTTTINYSNLSPLFHIKDPFECVLQWRLTFLLTTSLVILREELLVVRHVARQVHVALGSCGVERNATPRIKLEVKRKLEDAMLVAQIGNECFCVPNVYNNLQENIR